MIFMSLFIIIFVLCGALNYKYNLILFLFLFCVPCYLYKLCRACSVILLYFEITTLQFQYILILKHLIIFLLIQHLRNKITSIAWKLILVICFPINSNTRTRIVGGRWRHKITIYRNRLSVYIHILWQICDVTNRQLHARILML